MPNRTIPWTPGEDVVSRLSDRWHREQRTMSSEVGEAEEEDRDARLSLLPFDLDRLMSFDRDG